MSDSETDTRTRGIRNLDREMDTLRSLSARTPREENSSFGSTVRTGGKARNDAVVGSGKDEDDAPEHVFQDLWADPVDPVQRRYAPEFGDYSQERDPDRTGISR
jgi:hypothetical protein